MFTLFRNLSTLVRMANAIAAEHPGVAPRWSLYLTNRSFIALAFAVALNIAALVGFTLPLPTEELADIWVQIITASLALYAFGERLAGKTRVIWSQKQAAKALEEARAPDLDKSDLRAAALREAGA